VAGQPYEADTIKLISEQMDYGTHTLRHFVKQDEEIIGNEFLMS
jgi:hypothetical protein